MEFEELVWLPPDCRKKLDAIIAAEGSDAFGLAKAMYEATKAGGCLGLRYDLGTAIRLANPKKPAEIWGTKCGHCYELSLFLVAALSYAQRKTGLALDARYVETLSRQFVGHACVQVKTDGQAFFLDPARYGGRFNPPYRKYRALTQRQTVGNYFRNCSVLATPWSKSRRVKGEELKRLKKKSLQYARIALKYDPQSPMAKWMINWWKKKKIKKEVSPSLHRA